MAVAAAAVAAGCTPGSVRGDKAGGTGGIVILRMASTSSDLGDDPPVAEFVRRVAALSHGTVRIEVVNQWATFAPDAEVEAVRAVASGAVDFGWVGSRVFDTIGVSSFEALSAPMLIDSYPLENAVLKSALPDRMLPSLRRIGVTGVAILGDGLRLPIGVDHPLLAPADWRGVAFGTYRSGVQEHTIGALAASPVVAFGLLRARDLNRGVIQGFELDVRRYVRLGLVREAPYVTANVALWPQFDVVFANPGRLGSLTDQQRGWLEQAARGAAERSVGMVRRNASTFITKACSVGARFEYATAADLAAMRKVASVVDQAIERNPQTDAFVRRIRRLKGSTPADHAIHIPARCTDRR